METVRRQASLGTEFRRLYNEGENLDKITLGKVVQVNFRYNTVDIQLLDNTVLAKSGGSAGKFSAKIPVEFGGTTANGKPFGQVQPIAVGTLVLVGFVDGSKNTPIVLAVYQSSVEAEELSRAPFDGADSSDPSLQGLMNQHFKVYPSLTYEHIDGVGNRTVTFNGKSFMTMESDRVVSKITDDMNGVGYEDLSSSHYYSGELIEPLNSKAPTILFKHQGNTVSLAGEAESEHMFMFFLGQDGTYRTSTLRKDEDWRALVEMTTDGEISLRHQRDTKAVSGSKDYAGVSVTAKGVELRSGDKYLLLTNNGIEDNMGLGSQLGESGSGTSSTFQSTRDMLISQVYENLTFGTKNLLMHSNIGSTTAESLVKQYTLTEDFVEGLDYTITLKGSIAEGQAFGIYQNGYKNLVAIMNKNAVTGLYSATFTSKAIQPGYERTLLIYNTPARVGSEASIEWAQLEKGKVASDYRQAPEDFEKAIDQRMGTDRWIVNRYTATTDAEATAPNLIKIQDGEIPTIPHLRGKSEVSSDTVLDLVDSTAYTGHASSVFHLFTYLYTTAPKVVSTTLSHTSSASLYVNGVQAYANAVGAEDVQVALNLIQGWNSVDVILNNVADASFVTFDTNLKEYVDAMSCYFGGGMSASQIRQLSDEIDLRVQVGQVVAGINITNDIINGANIELNGRTTIQDDLVLNKGSIRSGDGAIDININTGTINLGRPLTINYTPVATTEDLEAIELTPGPKGDPGSSSYLWVRYSQDEIGTDMTMDPTGAVYIGLVNTTDPVAPTDPTAYSWTLIKGDQGIPGDPGKEGQTHYIHIKYSNDNGVTFTANNGETGGDYIGTYVDQIELDSLDPVSYTWSKIKGSDARLLFLSTDTETLTYTSTGDPFPDTQVATFTAKLQNLTGTVTFTAVAFNGTSELAGSVYLGGTGNVRTLAVADFPEEATKVTVVAELGNLIDMVSVHKISHGQDGENAVTGYLTNESVTLGATALGVVSSYTDAVGTFKVFDGVLDVTASCTFSLVVDTDIDGTINGNGEYSVLNMSDTAETASAEFKATYGTVEITKIFSIAKSRAGADGTSSYTHVAYATDDTGTTGFSTTDSSGKTYIGMYVDALPDDSMDPTKYKWTLIKGLDGQQGIPGAPGQPGMTPYLHIAYATNVTGTEGFSTTDSVGKTYLGQYTDFEELDSTDPTKYKWTLIKGTDGQPGQPGEPGQPGQTFYTWIKYADTPNSGMSNTPEGKTYMGIAYNQVDINESEDYAQYAWSLIRGEQGIPGPPGGEGVTNYTWVKYADDELGTGMSNFPEGKRYLGLSYNNPTDEESSDPLLYSWSPLYDNVQVGVENLLRKSNVSVSTPNYLVSSYALTEPMVAGRAYALRIWGSLGVGKTAFGARLNGAIIDLGELTDNGDGTYTLIFTGQSSGVTTGDFLNIYALPSSVTVDSTIEKIKLENGNVHTGYIQASIDVDDALNSKADSGIVDDLSGSYSTLLELAGGKLDAKTYEDFITAYGLFTKAYEDYKTTVSDDAKNLLKRTVAVEENLGNMSKKWNFVNSSIQIAEEGMLISGVIYNEERDVNEPTGMEILLSNDQISFLDGGTVVAFISGKVLQINHGVFVQSMRVGNHLMHSLEENPKITIVSYVGPDIV